MAKIELKDLVVASLAHLLLPVFFPAGIFPKFYNFVYSCKYAKAFVGGHSL